MAFSAGDVAEYFLCLVDEDAGDNISNLKLQKLLYYAQGFHLALNNKPLFDDSIKAWAHGPVVSKVYGEYKQYGAGAIPLPKDVTFSRYTKDVRDFLGEIYKVFGQFSAWRLREMTHKEPPWKETKLNEVISRKAMKEHFKTQVEEDES